MKFYWKILFLGVLLSLGGCEKDEVKKWSVQYKVLNRDGGNATYRVTYMLQNGSTKAVGPISTTIWESELLNDFESGQPVQIEMEIISGSGLYNVQILRDGAIHERETLSSGDTYLFLESVI